MRPSSFFLVLLVTLALGDGALLLLSSSQMRSPQDQQEEGVLVAGLGLTDLCLATEARYTRNVSITDPIAPFMDYPGALEHFPSGSFYGVTQ
ncbi:MAG: hypothetical protein PF442_00625 [Desulfobulbaceae bacterium]|jgi:hypothetical protein|nr:hypothetical protein [Desulfobulbaceae bacterium]